MKNSEFLKGILGGIPIGIGYLSVSFAFGIAAMQYGLSPLEAILISMTNLTSAGQLAGMPIIAAGGSFVELAATQLIINLRYSLMSVSLSQKLDKGATFLKRLLIAFGNTDEIFAVSIANDGKISSRYFYGLMLMPWIGWSTGTALGAIVGDVLPQIISSSLGLAIYAMLVAVVVPTARKHRPTAFCAALAIGLSCTFRYLPFLKNFAEAYSGFVIILCAVFSSVVFAAISPISREGDNYEH